MNNENESNNNNTNNWTSKTHSTLLTTWCDDPFLPYDFALRLLEEVVKNEKKPIPFGEGSKPEINEEYIFWKTNLLKIDTLKSRKDCAKLLEEVLFLAPKARLYNSRPPLSVVSHCLSKMFMNTFRMRLLQLWYKENIQFYTPLLYASQPYKNPWVLMNSLIEGVLNKYNYSNINDYTRNGIISAVVPDISSSQQHKNQQHPSSNHVKPHLIDLTANETLQNMGDDSIIIESSLFNDFY